MVGFNSSYVRDQKQPDLLSNLPNKENIQIRKEERYPKLFHLPLMRNPYSTVIIVLAVWGTTSGSSVVVVATYLSGIVDNNRKKS